MSEQLTLHEAWDFLKQCSRKGYNQLTNEELIKRTECINITTNARQPPLVKTRHQVVAHETFGGTTYRITKELDITITDICDMSDNDIHALLDPTSTINYIRSTLINQD